jgi:hypothetical protein
MAAGFRCAAGPAIEMAMETTTVNQQDNAFVIAPPRPSSYAIPLLLTQILSNVWIWSGPLHMQDKWIPEVGLLDGYGGIAIRGSDEVRRLVQTTPVEADER